jgi:hypothetical protein
VSDLLLQRAQAGRAGAHGHDDYDRRMTSSHNRCCTRLAVLCVCFVLAIDARAETLVVLLEGLGGRITSAGIVSLQKELSAIPNTIVPSPMPQSAWRSAVKLIEQQEPGIAIVLIGYSLGANNSTYITKKVKHVDELMKSTIRGSGVRPDWVRGV